jgi:hypothetical protein
MARDTSSSWLVHSQSDSRFVKRLLGKENWFLVCSLGREKGVLVLTLGMKLYGGLLWHYKELELTIFQSAAQNALQKK